MTRKMIIMGTAAAVAVSGILAVQATGTPQPDAAIPVAAAAAPSLTNSVAVTPAQVRAAVAEAEQKAAAKARAAAKRRAARAAAERSAVSAGPTSDSGIATSAYTGQYFDAGSDGTRQCIVGKESGGNYGIVSSTGMYHGAYQFMQGTSDAAAQRMGRSDLVGVPASRWSRHDQDEAFWTIWNHGAGRGNWPTAYGC